MPWKSASKCGGGPRKSIKQTNYNSSEQIVEIGEDIRGMARMWGVVPVNTYGAHRFDDFQCK